MKKSERTKGNMEGRGLRNNERGGKGRKRECELKINYERGLRERETK